MAPLPSMSYRQNSTSHADAHAPFASPSAQVSSAAASSQRRTHVLHAPQGSRRRGTPCRKGNPARSVCSSFRAPSARCTVLASRPSPRRSSTLCTRSDNARGTCRPSTSSANASCGAVSRAARTAGCAGHLLQDAPRAGDGVKAQRQPRPQPRLACRACARRVEARTICTYSDAAPLPGGAGRSGVRPWSLRDPFPDTSRPAKAPYQGRSAMTTRLFLRSPVATALVGERLSLESDALAHLRALRATNGATVRVFDGSGGEWQGVLETQGAAAGRALRSSYSSLLEPRHMLAHAQTHAFARRTACGLAARRACYGAPR
jgi:hypothetical protein